MKIIQSFDQRISYYRPKVKATNSWYPKVFIHCITISAINSFIVYILLFGLLLNYTYLQHVRILIDELARDEFRKKAIPLAEESTESEGKKKKHVKHWNQDNTRLIGYHMPLVIRNVTVETNNKEDNGSVRNFNRGKCILCRKTVTNCCKQCKMYLCTEEFEGHDMSCWGKFHTVQSLME